MQYISTRDVNRSRKYTAAQTITQGLAIDGGLLTPMYPPRLHKSALKDMCGMSYQQRCTYVMKPFLDEFTVSELASYAARAYGPDKFDTPAVAPVRTLESGLHCLELWHGPTCAFKDLALQMLPRLLTASLLKRDEKRTVCVLVATSGDTGKGALEGFRDVPGTRILVFYPQNGVSAVQQLQMTTQEGANVGVCAVRGNFDDAQTGVKRLFSDEDLRTALDGRGYFLSSANSINWGRVLPQIVYYASAYCDLVRDGQVPLGDPINICVPTGNFGNILAAYYAREMGVPIRRLVCASNRNNVLTDFLNTGVYDRNRTFYATNSPSMDILISSNLERLLFSMDPDRVKRYMEQLSETGRYEIDQRMKEKLDRLFSAGYCDETNTLRTIGEIYNRYHYLIDTHTAVAFDVAGQYRRQSGDNTPMLVVSTASPFKFCDSVLRALGQEKAAPGLEALDQLTAVTGLPAPAPLAGLRDKKVRFDQCVAKDRMVDTVLGMLS